MQYILVFGAVFLIMLAVILLFFFLINTTAEDVSGQVRKTFLKEMEVFDELYEEKAKKLKKVQDEYDKFNRNILRKTDDEPKQEAAAPSVKAAASMSGGSLEKPGFCQELPQYPPQFLSGYRGCS